MSHCWGICNEGFLWTTLSRSQAGSLFIFYATIAFTHPPPPYPIPPHFIRSRPNQLNECISTRNSHSLQIHKYKTKQRIVFYFLKFASHLIVNAIFSFMILTLCTDRLYVSNYIRVYLPYTVAYSSLVNRWNSATFPRFAFAFISAERLIKIQFNDWRFEEEFVSLLNLKYSLENISHLVFI